MLVPLKHKSSGVAPKTKNQSALQVSPASKPKDKARKGKKSSSKSEVKDLIVRDSMRTSSVFTRPNTVAVALAWAFDGTTYTNGLNYVAHACVQHLVHQVDDLVDYDRTIGPVHMKAYLVWALLDKIRIAGGLRGAYMHTIPKFPETYLIPKAWARILMHIGVYEKGGVSFQPTCNYSTVPSWTQQELTNAGSGFNKSPTPETDVTLMRFSTLKNEYYETTKTLTSQTMDDVYAIGDSISRLISRSSFGVQYGRPSAAALDGSFYCWMNYQTYNASFVNDDFDAAVAYIFSNRTLTQYWDGYPIVKAVNINQSFTNSEDAVTSAINALSYATQSFVWVCDQQDNIKRKKFYYAGQPLNTFLLRATAFSIFGFQEALTVTLEEFQRIGALSDAQAWALVCLANMAIHRRLADISFPCVGRFGVTWSLPSATSLKVPLPLPIAAYIKGIAPYVCKKTGQIVTFVPMGWTTTKVVGATYNNYDWFYAAQSATTLVGDADRWFAGTPSATSAPALEGVTVNAAWCDWTAVGAYRLPYPRALLDPLLYVYMGIAATTTNIADLFVTVPPPGLAPASAASVATIRTFSGSLAITIGTNWSVTTRYVATQIGSYVMLGQGDVMQAAFLCPRSVSEGTSTSNRFTPESMPYLFVFTTTAMSISAALQGALRKAFAPGSSFMLQMGKSRANVKELDIGYTKLATKDTSGSWGGYWNQIMDGIANSGSALYNKLEDSVKDQISKSVAQAGNFVFDRGVQLGIGLFASRSGQLARVARTGGVVIEEIA